MMSDPIFIFDAGSTKTDLLVYKNGKTTTQKLSGYNPNREDSSFLTELNNINIPLQSVIHFYGSGLGKQIKENNLTRFFSSYNISFNNDMIGGARATLGNSAGIISIMGTGGAVAYYDGQKITQQKGGYGYLIDDYGGGLELAKIIVSGWLNEYFSSGTNKQIEAHFNTTSEHFISTFYTSKNLHHLAGLCKIIPPLINTDPNLEKTINDYFNSFFVRHVSPMCEIQGCKEVNLVGSLALNFYSLINETATLHGIMIRSCIDKPIQNLLKYHLSPIISL